MSLFLSKKTKVHKGDTSDGFFLCFYRLLMFLISNRVCRNSEMEFNSDVAKIKNKLK